MRHWLINLMTILPLPFLLIIKSGHESVKINFARIVEAVIMAVIVGLLTSYITVRELTIKVDALDYRLNRIENFILYKLPASIASQDIKNAKK